MSHPAPVQSPLRKPIGTWRLHPGHAVCLRSRRIAVLRIFCGRVWVTVDGSHAGPTDPQGDRFLGPGDVLAVPVGARMVMEPWPQRGDQAPVHFDWSDQPVDPVHFAREVARPAGELAEAVGQAATAFGRVLGGLLRYSGFLVARRGKV